PRSASAQDRAGGNRGTAHAGEARTIRGRSGLSASPPTAAAAGSAAQRIRGAEPAFAGSRSALAVRQKPASAGIAGPTAFEDAADQALGSAQPLSIGARSSDPAQPA